MIDSFIRFIGLGICVYGLHEPRLPSYLLSEQTKGFMHKMSYLTNIGLFLTLSTLLLGLLIRILSFTDLKTHQKKITTLHRFIAIKNIGIETIITSGFWILYKQNPANVVSSKIYNSKYRYSFFKQLAMHVFPLCFALREGWIANPKKSFFNHIGFFIFTFLYYCFSKYIASQRKRWPYAVLDNIDETKRIAFFVGFMLVGQLSIELFIFVRRISSRRSTKKPLKPSH